MPFFHRLQGRLATQGSLRKLLVVEPDIALERCFQLFARSEMMAFLHCPDATVEPLNDAVSSGWLWLC